MVQRWQIYAPDTLDKRLREHLHKRFSGRTHGKLTEVICEAVEEFLDVKLKLVEVKGHPESLGLPMHPTPLEEGCLITIDAKWYKIVKTARSEE